MAYKASKRIVNDSTRLRSLLICKGAMQLLDVAVAHKRELKSPLGKKQLAMLWVDLYEMARDAIDQPGQYDKLVNAVLEDANNWKTGITGP